MPYKQLRILVEGNDDERFFNKIRPVLEKKFNFIQTWHHAQESSRRVRNFLKSIREMNSSYLFIKDINRAPCVTARKNSIKRKYGARIDINNVIIVVKEIESWYLAGLNIKSCKELGIRNFRKTNDITKEQFNSLIPKEFNSRIDFMAEVLKRFSLETAKQKNKSFAYFMKRI